VLKPIPADPARAGQAQLGPDAASRKLDLSPKGGVARVELPLDAEASRSTKQVTVQASFVTGGGKTVYLDPQVLALPKPIQVSTSTDGKGTTTTTITQAQEGDGQTSRRQMTITRGSSSGNPPSSSGAAKKGAFQVGDKVTVDWAGATHDAEVVGIAPTGWIKVKFPSNGIVLTPTLPPDKIKPAGGSEAKKAPAGATLRTWSSKGSKFQVKAKFVELSNGSVALEKEDGETVTVALEKLSEADQKLARQLSEESEDDPFASKPGKK
jgi:hypothetical protein